MKRTAEANAKRSESMKRVWAERKRKALISTVKETSESHSKAWSELHDFEAIHSVYPRCKRTFWDKLTAWFGGAV